VSFLKPWIGPLTPPQAQPGHILTALLRSAVGFWDCFAQSWREAAGFNQVWSGGMWV